jgi:hypothetical protein
MTETRSLNRFKYAATLLGAMAVVALAPAVAHAQPVQHNDSGGCHYTDKDGYDIPIDEGQSVIVDGKTVTCQGGSIVLANAPAGTGGVKPNSPSKIGVLIDLPRTAAIR